MLSVYLYINNIAICVTEINRKISTFISFLFQRRKLTAQLHWTHQKNLRPRLRRRTWRQPARRTLRVWPRRVWPQTRQIQMKYYCPYHLFPNNLQRQTNKQVLLRNKSCISLSEFFHRWIITIRYQFINTLNWLLHINLRSFKTELF